MVCGLLIRSLDFEIMAVAILFFLEPEVAVFKHEGEDEEKYALLRLYPDWMRLRSQGHAAVATCQSQQSPSFTK